MTKINRILFSAVIALIIVVCYMGHRLENLENWVAQVHDNAVWRDDDRCSDIKLLRDDLFSLSKKVEKVDDRFWGLQIADHNEVTTILDVLAHHSNQINLLYAGVYPEVYDLEIACLQMGLSPAEVAENFIEIMSWVGDTTTEDNKELGEILASLILAL
jgi:hypothetical protein